MITNNTDNTIYVKKIIEYEAKFALLSGKFGTKLYRYRYVNEKHHTLRVYHITTSWLYHAINSPIGWRYLKEV